MVTMNDDVVKLLLDRIDHLQKTIDEMRAEKRATNKEVYDRLKALELKFAEREHHFAAIQKYHDTHVEPEEWFNSKLAKIFWPLVAGGIAGWLTRGIF